MMNAAQAAAVLSQRRARFLRIANGFEWWVTPDNGWISKRALGNGYFELRSYPPGSCACGG